MSEDDDVRAVVDHARRLGRAVRRRDRHGGQNSHDVARPHGRDITELAAAAAASCTTDSTLLPRSLYTNGFETA